MEEQTLEQQVRLDSEELHQEHLQRGMSAMILSIVGLAVFFLPIANIAGLILSIIGLVKSRANRSFAEQNGIRECGQNSAAFICGIVGIILNILSILVLTAAAVLLILFAANSFQFFSSIPSSFFEEFHMLDALSRI